MTVKVMRERGVEPLRFYPLDPKSISLSSIKAILSRVYSTINDSHLWIMLDSARYFWGH